MGLRVILHPGVLGAVRHWGTCERREAQRAVPVGAIRVQAHARGLFVGEVLLALGGT